MLRIEKTDLLPLDLFPLKWRWNKLPDDVLNSIKPIVESKSNDFCQYSFQFMNETGLEKKFFKNIEQIDASDETSKISKWLLNCSSVLNQKVIVSWDKNNAVLVEWKLFCNYWDDFCYPSSDDVSIFPLNEEWMLFYSHNENFIFGRRHN